MSKPRGSFASLFEAQQAKKAVPLAQVKGTAGSPIESLPADNLAASKLAGVQTQIASKPAGESNSLPAPPSNSLPARLLHHQKAKVTIRLGPSMVQEIKVLCARANIDIQEFYEQAASRHLEYLLAQGYGQPPASKLAHDDMMIFKTHEDIIMRYQTYTLQKWASRDDRDGQRYNEVDLRLLDIALISTIEKKLRGNTAKQPVKSFNYFTQEIDLLLEQQRCGELPAALDEYHKYVLSTWEKRIRKIRDEKWGKA